MTITDAPRRRRTRVPHKAAVAFLLVPFGILFTLFYVAPILFAIVQSTLVVRREGTFAYYTAADEHVHRLLDEALFHADHANNPDDGAVVHQLHDDEREQGDF